MSDGGGERNENGWLDGRGRLPEGGEGQMRKVWTGEKGGGGGGGDGGK